MIDRLAFDQSQKTDIVTINDSTRFNNVNVVNREMMRCFGTTNLRFVIK